MVLNYTLIKLFKNGNNSIYYACCDEKMNTFAKRKQTYRYQKQTYGHQRGNVRGRDKSGAWMNVQTLYTEGS